MKVKTVDGVVNLRGNRCLCRGCDRAFSAVTSFDKHRVRFECKHPADTGLIYNEAKGFWQQPAPEVPIEFHAVAQQA